MPVVAEAVRGDATHTLLDLAVTPGAKGGDRFPSGFEAWRGRIEARVAARPEKGEANAALAALVAEFFGLPASSVAVIAGATDRRKTLRIDGLPRERALARLVAALA